MKLAWAYNCKTALPKGIQDSITFYFINSINRAKKLGYNTEIYTNSSEFSSVADKVINVPDDYYNKMWDSFKFFALSYIDDKTILVDGDIFFHNLLPKLDTKEVYFDTFETNNWNFVYKKVVNQLTDLNLNKIIPEWKNTPQPIMNTGLLYFNSKELKDKYLDRWFKFYNFCIKHEHIDFARATAVGAQYLLTLLSEGYTTQYFSNKLNETNDFYIHHSGKVKNKVKIKLKNTLI